MKKNIATVHKEDIERPVPVYGNLAIIDMKSTKLQWSLIHGLWHKDKKNEQDERIRMIPFSMHTSTNSFLIKRHFSRTTGKASRSNLSF